MSTQPETTREIIESVREHTESLWAYTLELRTRIAQLESIVSATLKEVPVGNIRAHTPENLPGDMKHYVAECVRLEFENERLEAALAARKAGG
jgi:hypothetical protein